MILVVDDNKYRREEICKLIRKKGVYSNGCIYSEYKLYTLPLITLFVNPYEYVDTYTTQNTVFVINTKYKNIKINDMRSISYIIREDIDEKKLIDIINEKYHFNLDIDYMKEYAIDNKNKKFYVGNVNISLGVTEFSIVKFLFYNANKKFTIDEIYNYIKPKCKLNENTFINTCSRINKKCLIKNRDKIIFASYGRYFLT